MHRFLKKETRRKLDTRRRSRSGVAVLWLIAAGPAILMFLCIMVEVANVWNARVKLEVALESAALAGVKTWAELTEADTVPDPHDSPGEFAKTSAARNAAVAAAAANNVAGMSIVLDRNEADDGIDDVGYDNANCTGDLLLGGFPTTGSTDFNVTAAVGCGRSTTVVTVVTIDFDIDIDTGGGAGNTLNTADAFNLSFTSAEPGLSITEIQIDLRAVPMAPVVQDNGSWDFGTLNVFNAGAVEADGNGPATHATSDVTILTAAGDGTGIMTLTFAVGDWTTGENLIFGVDTDNVESTGAGPDTVNDEGGDFGENGGAAGNLGRIAFSFGFNGGASAGNTLNQQLASLGGGSRGLLQGNSANFPITVVTIVPDEDFAVLAQQTLSVNAICNNLFGIPVGPFTISGRAVATARCAGANSTVVNNPLLVHVTGTTCP